MAYPFGGNWLTVAQLVELFTAMGCSLNEPGTVLAGPDGTYPIRFIYSDVTDDFVSLNSYDNDERVPPSEVENWERRLGVTIPKGERH